ncbi:MAG: aldose 1-epimerase [Acetobacteraceae bacterium]
MAGGEELRPATRFLRAGNLSAEIAPVVGGGLARFDLTRAGRRESLLRPWPESGTGDPNLLACYPLLPWSNRLAAGGITLDGTFYRMPCLMPGEKLPIHGDGWRSPWQVARADKAAIVLELRSRAMPPFDYMAELSYALSASALTMALSLTHLGARPLAYGLGFHPWLPRTQGTVLEAPADTVWLEDDDHLPTVRLDVAARPEWNFRAPQPLPVSWINASFEGWDGNAMVRWPERNLALEMRASANLRRCIVYSPGPQADFFCFEPISHRINAHAESNPEAAGLITLHPGDTVSCAVTLTPR